MIDAMSRNEEELLNTGISKSRTPEEIGDFWDTHSLDDHWGQTREVDFEVRALRRRRVTLDPPTST
jgi:hypothetical protein